MFTVSFIVNLLKLYYYIIKREKYNTEVVSVVSRFNHSMRLKRRIKRWVKEFKYRISIILAILVVVLIFVAAFLLVHGGSLNIWERESLHKEEESSDLWVSDSYNTVAAGSMEVHYIDVGQGDATLIRCGDRAMLIDAGDNSKGTKVQAYLKKHGVSRLDYVIGTHPDSDHIGGLDVIIYKFPCQTILMPNKTSDSYAYRDVLSAIKSKSYSLTYPKVGQTYTLGDAEFTIIAPTREYEDSNEASICILLKYGQSKFLFTGDAESQSETDMIAGNIDIECDVYKVGHHGSKSSSGVAFLNETSPAYAVISCGADNDYGHPHTSTLNNLKDRGIKLFRTDKQGTVIAVTDGKEIKWNCSPYQ